MSSNYDTTLGVLKNQVIHALGGSPASTLDIVTIINQAGRHLFHYPWKFRERPPKVIETNVDVDYVSLHSDMGEITCLKMKDGLTDSIRLTTIDEVVEARNSTISTGANYLAAIVWPEAYGTGQAEQFARIELAPTPTAVDEIVVVYKSKWMDFSINDSDDTKPSIPLMAEAVLFSFVRAFALGYEEGNLAQRLYEVESSPQFQALSSSDGLIQPEYGPLRNGVVGGWGHSRLPFDTLPGPGYTPPEG